METLSTFIGWMCPTLTNTDYTTALIPYRYHSPERARSSTHQTVVAHDVLPGAQVGLAPVHEGGGEGEDGEGLPDAVESGELHHPVSLGAELHHQPVVGQVGDVVAGLPDGHLYTGLDCAVLLEPPGLLTVNSGALSLVQVR